MHLNSESKAILFVVLVITFALPRLSASAIPSTGPTDYEQYGPRVDGIHMRFLGDTSNVFAALDTGEIDIIDWPLTKMYKDKWENPLDPEYYNIQVVGSGGEYGYYILDMQENNTKKVAPPFSTQSYVMTGDPTVLTVTVGGETYTTTRGALARRSLAHMVNRTYVISDVLGGLADPIYTPVPVALGSWVYPDAQQYATDKNLAKACLDAAGIVDNDADGWRDIPGTYTGIILDFWIRYDLLGAYSFGVDLANRIEVDLHIHVNRQIQSFPPALGEGDLYTGYWGHESDLQTPDYLPWFYSSMGYPYPNYMRYCGYRDLDADGQIDFDPRVEAQASKILSSFEYEDVKAAVWEMQRLMQDKENVYTIPVWCASSPKAYRINKIGTTEPWQGIVNERGFGINSWWTKLNAHTAANPDSGTLTYGLSTETLGMLNPIYAQWYWDWEVMGMIYDGMIGLDPYTREEIPSVASSWISNIENTVLFEKHTDNYFNNRYDVGEFIYWDADLSSTVSKHDKRLTAVGSYNAGSKVKAGDTDIGSTLITFLINEKHQENVKRNGFYDVGEYIYRDVTVSDYVSAGDIRLTDVGPYLAGSTVASGDTDIGNVLITFGRYVSAVTFALRNDVFWHDGQQLDADDIIFTLTELWSVDGTGYLQTRGLPDPWWVSNIANIHHIDKIDQFHIKVWMNSQTWFALREVGCNIILPEHIWRPIAASGDINVFAPDTQLVGSGPFRIYPFTHWDVYTPYLSVDVYAYKPGSVPGNPHGYFQYEYIQAARANPKTLVGTGLESYQRVFCTIYNYKLTALTGVTVTLHANGTLIGGPTVVNVPAATDNGRTPGVKLLAFSHTTTFPNTWKYKVTASHGTTTDIDEEQFNMKTTVPGDIDETANAPGNVVNVIDANRLVANYGSTGPWNYPNADITDLGGSANIVDIFDAAILSINYPQ